MTAKYTGILNRGKEPDTIEGWIEDAWGWRINILGRKSERGGYTVEATLGEVPDALKISGLDK